MVRMLYNSGSKTVARDALTSGPLADIGKDAYMEEPTTFPIDPSKSARENYAAYMKSDQWEVRRRAAVVRAGCKCQLCGHRGKLDVHHNDYRRLGQELPEDLIALCRPCHDRFHGKAVYHEKPAKEKRERFKPRPAREFSPAEVAQVVDMVNRKMGFRSICQRFGTNNRNLKIVLRKAGRFKPKFRAG